VGLDAFVRCRCWEDGLISAPPVPRELIAADEDEPGYLGLSVPYDGNEDLHGRFDAWLAQGACAHERMEQARARVANWAGYRLFQQALGAVGWERFPTLRAYLPQGNGGTLPAAYAAAALAELREFEDAAHAGEQVHLVDEDTGRLLAVGVPSYGGVFMLCGSTQHHVGVDEAGLFVRDVSVAPEREEFRSLRCTQEVIGDRADGKGQLVCLTDASTSEQATVALAGPIGRDHAGPAGYPRRMRVKKVARSGSDFCYITDSLTEVLRAAQSTGNPVVWC
jgi:hypothetical protein